MATKAARTFKADYTHAVHMHREACHGVTIALERRNEAYAYKCQAWLEAGLPVDAPAPQDNRDMGNVQTWYLLCEQALTEARAWRDQWCQRVRSLHAIGVGGAA